MKTKQIFHFFYLILFFLPIFFFHSTVNAAAQTDETWFLNDIQAQNAWASLADSSADFSSPIIVAVIDTGCDYRHPLIKNALWINSAEQNGVAGIDDDGNGYIDDIYGIDTYNNDSDPMDDSVSAISGHGTHVAGCMLQAAGVTETENPFHIQLMPIKAGDAYGNFHAKDVAKALHYAADNGASVINLSISSLKSPQVFEEALEYASQSAVIVASSGNQGLPTSDSMYTNCGNYYPAAYPYVAGVMSYGTDHRLSSFSNWDYAKGTGAEYEIAAPGEAILSCTYNNAQKTMSGTSMSAGIVSGCAALLAAKYAPQTIYSAKDLTAHLISSGDEDIAFTDLYGKNHTFRRINMQKLLSDTPRPNLSIPNFSVSKNDSDRNTYDINYRIANKGCFAQNINVSISADLPEAVLYNTTEPSYSLSALSNSEGTIRITLPDDSTAAFVHLTIQISYENGADLADREPYTCTKEISIPTASAPPDTEKEVPLMGITVSASPQLVMKRNTSLQLTVSYLPENTTDDRTLTFQSSNPETADIDETGTIFAKKTGTAKITVTSSKQHIREITVIVYDNTKNPDTSNPVLTVPESPTQETEPPSAPIQKGGIYTINGMKYKITNAGTNQKGTVTLIGTTKKKASLSSLTVKKTVRIGDAGFRVTAIGKSAFSQCKNLKTVKIPNSVQTIGTACFSKCTSLKNLTIGSGTLKISSRAFDRCRNLKKITVKSKKITFIGKNAFRGIPSNAKIHAPHKFLTQLSKYL